MKYPSSSAVSPTFRVAEVVAVHNAPMSTTISNRVDPAGIAKVAVCVRLVASSANAACLAMMKPVPAVPVTVGDTTVEVVIVPPVAGVTPRFVRALARRVAFPDISEKARSFMSFTALLYGRAILRYFLWFLFRGSCLNMCVRFTRERCNRYMRQLSRP